jgi:hypothetical protein
MREALDLLAFLLVDENKVHEILHRKLVVNALEGGGEVNAAHDPAQRHHLRLHWQAVHELKLGKSVGF